MTKIVVLAFAFVNLVTASIIISLKLRRRNQNNKAVQFSYSLKHKVLVLDEIVKQR